MSGRGYVRDTTLYRLDEQKNYIKYNDDRTSQKIHKDRDVTLGRNTVDESLYVREETVYTECTETGGV